MDWMTPLRDLLDETAALSALEWQRFFQSLTPTTFTPTPSHPTPLSRDWFTWYLTLRDGDRSWLQNDKR